MDKIHQRIATELRVGVGQVTAAAELLGEGATVPFIARYRKEVTGNLDEVQIGAIDERRTYLAELDARKETVLKEIGSQGKLSDELKRKIESTLSKTELEDLYLPYKPKRRTRATIARERGLEPLAEKILLQETSGARQELGAPFVDVAKEVPDLEAAAPAAKKIGFVDHERTDVMDAARERGCVALAKGKFSSELPRLLL